MVDARPVTGTPFILVHWYTRSTEYELMDPGGRLVLVDSSGTAIWSLDAANDYAEGNYGIGFFDDHPAMLPPVKPRHFDIRLFASNEQITFAVERKGADEWSVSEVSRRTYEKPPPPLDTPIGTPKGTLKYLGELDLGAGHSQPSPFRTVFDFTFDKQGNIHFWRRTDDGEGALVHVDPKTGDVIDERAFPEIESRFGLHWTDTARLKDNRFVVMRKVPRDSNENPAWLVDLVTGEEEPFAACPGGRWEGIGRFSSGEFVTVGSTLACYGASGKLKWEIDREHPDGFQILGQYPKDVVVTADRHIGVLTMGSIELLDHAGRHLKTISLIGAFGTDEFGGRPGYLREIVADADGGFLIQNSRTPPVVLRYKADGSVRSRWSPRHPDGRTFDIRPGVRVAPDGRLWTSDGESIMRLTDDGVVDFVLGEVPQTDTLGEIAGLTVAPDGRIYAVAKQSGGIHVYNSSGELERIDAPEPTDFAGTIRGARIFVTEDGDYYVKQTRMGVFGAPNEYLHFSPSGHRMGIVTFEHRLGWGWVFQPGTGYRCGFASGETLTIVDTTDRWPSSAASAVMISDNTRSTFIRRAATRSGQSRSLGQPSISPDWPTTTSGLWSQGPRRS
jgi:sugar lactone lactonase YvrE